MLDVSQTKLEIWETGLPEGELELLEHRYLLGELAMTILVHDGPDGRAAFELLVDPMWFGVFRQERMQHNLGGLARTLMPSPRFFKVPDSPLVEQMCGTEVGFNVEEEVPSHWLVLSNEACTHIIGHDEPKFRQVY